MRDIASPSNPLVKRARSLRSRKNREAEGAFMVEGIHHVLAALEHEAPVESVLVAPDLLTSPDAIAGIESFDAGGGDVVRLTVEAFEAISGRENPAGLAAVVRSQDLSLEDLDTEGKPAFLVAHEISNPGNLGSMLRTAEATGARAVVVSGRSTDIHDPTSVRASLGALFRLPVVRAEIGPVIEWTKEMAISVVTTSSRAPVDFRTPRYVAPLAIVVGSEGSGLPEELLGWGDHQVHIPMRGSVTSLNVSVAAGILLFGIAERVRLLDDENREEQR